MNKSVQYTNSYSLLVDGRKKPSNVSCLLASYCFLTKYSRISRNLSCHDRIPIYNKMKTLISIIDNIMI